MFIREKCNVCLNEKNNIIGRTFHIVDDNCPDVHLKKYFRMTGTSEIFIDFLVCGSCGQIFQKQLLDDNELSRLETDGAPPPQKHPMPESASYLKTNQLSNSKRFEGVYDFIMDNLGSHMRGMSVLDVGGRDGSFCMNFLKHGIKATSIDVDDWAGKMKPGVDFIHGNIDSFNFKDNKYDLIILNHVLEHVFFPKLTLDLCRELLTQNGFIFIDIPILPLWPGTWHRSEFHTLDLLTETTRLSGFDLVDFSNLRIAYDNSIIGGFRLLVRKSQKPKKEIPRNMRNYSLDYLSDFHNSMIRSLNENNETYAIYGVNDYSKQMLMPILENLNKKNFLFWVDDDPINWGQNIYGITISSPKVLEKKLFSRMINKALKRKDLNRDVQNLIIMTPNKNETRLKLFHLAERGINLIDNHRYLQS